MVDIAGEPWLVTDGRLLVITPQVTVAVLAAGYQPVLHSSAGQAGR
jgi:hypothetical protein